MKVAEKPSQKSVKRKGKSAAYIITTIICLLALAVVISAVVLQRFFEPDGYTVSVSEKTEHEEVPTASLDPTAKWRFGYVASLDHEVAYTDENGNPLGTLTRGSKVKFNAGTDGRTEIFTDGSRGYLQEGAFIANNISDVIPSHTLYIRTAVNLRNENGRLLEIFAEKGESVEVTGYDYFKEDGSVHMYRVNYGGEDGYIMPWYLEKTEEAALVNYDGDGNYAIHADREDHYGGGFGANLDYFPREKGEIEGNIMPDECRTLYLVNWRLDEVDDYISIADRSGINAFVVDITDGSSIGYAGDVMKEYCPSGAAAAENTVEEYKAAIQKIKDAGYYVIGRITTFNDTYFIEDHPECAITDNNGDPLKLSGVYWPTPFDRTAWQYKVDLAVEAVELMGFNEIQFDYVRFPDLTSGYEEAGTIDFHNEYGETKAQAIQRFLMYATDIIHEHGAYVSADVYGESAYTYVTAYGQYWPAISNVVDVISGMPYPDHFGWTDTWRPWEHPYDTLLSWGQSVMTRQSETATPASVRTWIQAYNAIREPYNTYGADEVAAQIKGLRDAGCTGGYMTWNAASSLDKYESLIPAFDAP